MVDNTKKNEEVEDIEVEIEGDEKPEIVVEDDTPEIDKNRRPVPKDEVEALEKDELTDFEGKVRDRMVKLKRVWHDERRAKEAETREKEEAVNFARRVMDENKRLKAFRVRDEENLVNSYKSSATMEMNAAKKAYKEAYEAGDGDKLVDAQERMQVAGHKLAQVATYRPPVQEVETEVESTQEVVRPPSVDHKTLAWQERNSWWGTDEEMTAAALGLHQKLERQNGKQFVGSDDYWKTIDSSMRRRFPEEFEEDKPEAGTGKPAASNGTRHATVVAPATRSTSSKKIVLRQSQINIAKRLGVTPEQYALAQRKLEN